MKDLKTVALLIFATATMSAQDLNSSEVPTKVQSTFSSAYTDARDIEWEKKGDHFKVEFEIGRMDHDIWYDGDGKVMKSKLEITESDLPSAVASAVKSKYDDYRIDSVEVHEQDGIKTYKVEIEKLWIHERKLILDASGKIISDFED